MSLSERIRKLRSHLQLTGADFGKLIGMKKSGVSMVENGERGLDFAHIERLVEQCNIDPRYFFGMIDEPALADLARESEKPDYDELVREIRELKRKVSPADGSDQVAYRVRINTELRDLVSMIQFLDGSMLREIQGVVYGYIHGRNAPREENGEPQAESG